MAPDERTPSSQQQSPGLAPIDSGGEVSLAAVSDRAREAIVRSYRIVKVPDYFLDQWLPLLGPSRWLAVLAFRQLAFVHKCNDKTGQQPSQTTYRELSKWSGQSRPQMHKLLRSPGLLTWFVEPEEGTLGEHPGSRSERRTYLVRIEVPLTPTDQARLQSFLEANRAPDDEGWLKTLHGALAAKKAKAPPKGSLPKRAKSIQKMVQELRDPAQPLPEEIDWACDELLERWQTQNFGQVTHYFIKKWLPDLTPGLGCLMIWSRRHANRQPETMIGRLASVGWTDLAQAVGVSSKSVRRWFTDQERYPHTLLFVQPIPSYAGAGEIEQLSPEGLTIAGERLALTPATLVRHNLRVGDFVQATAERRDGTFQALKLQLAEEMDIARTFTETDLIFDVKLTDPIHADDQPYYRALLESQVTSPDEPAFLQANVPLADQRPKAAKKEEGTKVDKPRTILDSRAAEVDPLATELDIAGAEVDNHRTAVNVPAASGDNLRPSVDNPGTSVDALRGVLRGYEDSTENAVEEQLRLPRSPSPNGDHPHESAQEVAVVPHLQWDIEQILTQAAIPKRDKAVMLAKREDSSQKLVAWLLWSLATSSIDAPVLHAVSRVKRGEPPPDEFMKLAGVPPFTLGAWIRDDAAGRPYEFRQSIRNLRRNDALQRLSDLGCAISVGVDIGDTWDDTDDPEQGEEAEADARLDAPVNERGMTARQAWEAVMGQLQAELPRAVYDTWVRHIELERFDAPDTIVLGVANDYARDWLEDRLSSTARRVLIGVVGRPLDVEFAVFAS